MRNYRRGPVKAAKEPDVLSSGQKEDTLQFQQVAFHQQKRLVWMLGLGIITAVFLEFLGRALFRLFDAPFTVTGLLTLAALFLWGAVSVYIILQMRSSRYVTVLVVMGACCIVFSQTVSVAVNFSDFLRALLIDTYPWANLISEEGLFLVGLLALFTSLYASIFETHRSNLHLEVERRRLASEIQERKYAQEQLRRSEHTLRMLIAVNPESLLLVDASRRVIVVNQAAAARLGVSLEGLVGKELLQYYPPDRADIINAYFETATRTGDVCRFEEERLGRFYECYICPVKGEDAGAQRYAVMHIDITERRKMEEELRLLNRDLETGIRQRIQELQRTNERLLDALNLNQELITVSPLGIVVFKMTGACLMANRAALEILECDGEESQSDKNGLTGLLERIGLHDLARDVRAGDAPLTGEVHAVLPSGRDRWLEYHASFFNRAGEKHLLVILNDISERMYARLLMEEQRQELEKASLMTTIGLMVGGIAHEVRKPLSVLTLSVDQLKACYDQGVLVSENVQSLLEIIFRNVTLMNTLIRSLVTLSREGTHDPFEQVPVKRIMEDAVILCEHDFRKYKIDLCVRETPEVLLECRPCQLSQVLANLLSNALDAVKTLEERWVNVDVDARNESIVFVVTDSGTIPPLEIREKIFQPLFTTKPAGAGMGLGLSISKRIIENHNGRFMLDESHPNTRFLVEVPLKQGNREDV